MDKLKLSLKDVVYILLIFSGVIFNYSTVNSQLTENTEAIEEIQETLKKNNLELIMYKLDEIKKILDK